jgi:peptidylprolyl isomerase
MKLKLPVIAAFVAMLSLTACGGGSDSSGSSTAAADNPSSYSQTDTVLGTGTQATTGAVVGIRYTVWLYSASAADHKGTQLDTNLSNAAPMVFLLGAGAVVSGVDQGVAGMNIGGKRTLILPASLAYGSTGYGTVPANAGLVFDVQLTDVQALADAPAFSTVDTLSGTGATAAAGNTVSVRYSAYLYSASAADHKGILVDTNTTSTTAYSFVLGASPLQTIAGFDQGVTGMQVGGKRTITVPASLAYGTTGSGTVPANSGMVFDVELVTAQ